MSKMRVAQVSQPGGPFEIVEREIPEPGAGTVRVKGKCRTSDGNVEDFHTRSALNSADKLIHDHSSPATHTIRGENSLSFDRLQARPSAPIPPRPR